jgi:hypothetical protein
MEKLNYTFKYLSGWVEVTADSKNMLVEYSISRPVAPHTLKTITIEDSYGEVINWAKIYGRGLTGCALKSAENKVLMNYAIDSISNYLFIMADEINDELKGGR